MKQPAVSFILRRVAPKIGARVHIEPEYGFAGYVQFQNGKKSYFFHNLFSINKLGSVSIAKDKAYANYFLRKLGYSMPVCLTFFSKERNDTIATKRDIADGLKFAKQVGYPVIVKPNDQSKGLLVTKVHTPAEFRSVARRILDRFPVAVVEKFYQGNDYRIVVLDDKVISAYQRIALSVIGNGKHTIKQLLKHKQAEFEKKSTDAKIDMKDFRIQAKLKSQGLTMNSIPKKGQRVFVLDNANLSCGGDAVDLTHRIHPEYKQLAISIAKDMDLRLCGVDILSKDIDLPLDKDHVVLEVNAAPGLDNYAASGKKQRKIVEDLYLQILKSLETA